MIPRSELYYFVPDQVVLQLKHVKGINPIDIEEAVTSFLNNQKMTWVPIDTDKQQYRILTFPLLIANQEYEISLALIQFKLTEPELYGENVYGNQTKLIDTLINIYNNIGLGITPYTLANGISLVAISPNWLFSCSPHQPGVGGPGSWPVPANQPGVGQEKFYFPEIENSGNLINEFAGLDVDVAILDTAISEKELDNALINRRDHSLLQKLWGGARMLDIDRYAFSALENINHFSPMGHRYEMPDHGLFVAGIINTIVPMAKIKLYEVLNNHGMGSYESIYTGLKKVLQDFVDKRTKNPDQKLIINLSLVLDLLLFDITEENYNILSESIRDIFTQLLTLENVLVVAAAGNDTTDPAHRPFACYPAALPGVIGVGALPKDSLDRTNGKYKPASYSNRCDQPSDEGYMTLGGEPGFGEGILGVYTHDFPVDRGDHNPGYGPVAFGFLRQDKDLSPDHLRIDYIKNCTGWAWWAGTSFAAPVISGLLAAGWSKNWDSRINVGANTLDNANNFLGSVLSPGLTTDNERVIVVTQP